MNTHCSMGMSAEHRSKLQPFIGNDDVSIMSENSIVGCKQSNNHMEVFAEGFTINSKLKIGQEIQTLHTAKCVFI